MQKMNEIDELTYYWEGEYLIPDLDPPDAPRVGKFGEMRHQYLLRNHHRGIFDGMLLEGSLNAHLEEIDRQANEMMERLVILMAKAEGITERLKALDQRKVGPRHEQHKDARRGNNIQRFGFHINDKIHSHGQYRPTCPVLSVLFLLSFTLEATNNLIVACQFSQF